MLGGGFRPGTFTLVQESIGSEGSVLLENIIEVQLALSNKVLLIVTDPTMFYVTERLLRLNDDNLTILDLSSGDVSDRLDLSVKIKDARKAFYEKCKDGTLGFVFFLTLNPFFLNMDASQVIQILSDNLPLTISNQTIDIALVQKGLVKPITFAQLSAIMHGVVDLSSEFRGSQKINTLRILKFHGQKYDLNVVPFELYYDPNGDKVSFMINSAFLSSFETFRTLLHWERGEIKLANIPYLMAPVTYFNAFMEIATNLDPEKGKTEIIERAQGIGRKLTRSVAEMYFLSGLALFRSTVRTAALQGWGEGEIEEVEPEENLIVVHQSFPRTFTKAVYLDFLEGLYRGIISTSLARRVRYFHVRDDEEPGVQNAVVLRIRLQPKATTESLEVDDDFGASTAFE